MNWAKGVWNYVTGQQGQQQGSDDLLDDLPCPSSGGQHSPARHQQAGARGHQQQHRPSAKQSAPRGFKRTVAQGPKNRPEAHHVPVIQDADHNDGGIQSLSWYVARQRQDEDGEVADEFFVESGPKMALKQVRTRPRPAIEVLMIDKGNVVLSH